MKKWEIWDLPQKIARKSSDPAQPLDKRRAQRPYLVISPDSFLAAGGAATCVPIQTDQPIGAFAVVPLDALSTGLKSDSFAVCSQIVSVPQSSFGAKLGVVKAKQIADSVESALKDYLDLW